MDKLFQPFPADFPWLGGQPLWVLFVVLAVLWPAIAIVNKLYFDWLHRRFPGLFKPRVILALVGLCIAGIAIMMTLNPPSEVQKAFERARQATP